MITIMTFVEILY